MRKWIVLLALFAVACSKAEKATETPYVPSDEAIGFVSQNNLNQAATKGDIVGSEGFANGDAFGVFAFLLTDGEWNAPSETPNFMYNQSVVLDNSSGTDLWKYSPVKYWSNNSLHRIKFFAYYPHSAPSADNGIVLSPNNQAGYPTVQFTPNSNVSHQVDFMAATTSSLQKPASVTDFVTLDFNHQLTQVIFSAKVNGPKESITNVQITQIVFEGSKQFDGAYTVDGFEWGSTASSSEDIYTISGAEQLKQDLTLDTTTYTELVTEAGTMMLIPQKFTQNQVVITITYEVITIDGATTTHTQAIEVPEHEFFKGKRMVYQFTIDLMDEYYIKLDAVSEELWSDKEIELELDEMFFNLTGNTRAYNWVDNTTDTERLTIGIEYDTNLPSDAITVTKELTSSLGVISIDPDKSMIYYTRPTVRDIVTDRLKVVLDFGGVTRTLYIDIVIKDVLIEFTITVEPWDDQEVDVESSVFEFSIVVEPWSGQDIEVVS